MAAPGTGPCAPWTELDDVRVCCVDDPPDDDTILEAIDSASEILYELSGRRYSGLCTETLRPCSRSTEANLYSLHGSIQNVEWQGGGYGWGVCACQSADACGCGTIPQIGLGRIPVVGISEVRIDGAVLPPSAYRVDEFRWLVRIDGGSWPCCQDLLADDATDLDTFAVDVDFGTAPPVSGRRAASILACELAKSCVGAECQLPRRVTTITRQGVSMTLLDPFDFLNNGSTGIYEVDLFLKAVNPSGRRRPMAVASPDVTSPARRVDT
jgi:hypothetical protein